MQYTIPMKQNTALVRFVGGPNDKQTRSVAIPSKVVSRAKESKVGVLYNTGSGNHLIRFEKDEIVAHFGVEVKAPAPVKPKVIAPVKKAVAKKTAALKPVVKVAAKKKK